MGTVIWAFMVAFVLAGAVVLARAGAGGGRLAPQWRLFGMFPVIVYAFPVAIYNWGASLVKRALADAAHFK